MSMRSSKGEDLKEQFEVHKQVVIQNSVEKLRTIPPPIYYDMPRPEQMMLTDVGAFQRDFMGCPDGFFGIDHPNTIWMVNLLKDTSEWRLQKCVVSLRSRPLFDEKRFYQMIDRPSYYWGDSARLEKSLFKPAAMLYLNAFGVALYLKSDVGANRLSSAVSGKTYMVNVSTPQFASFVNDNDCDLVKFHYDFLCVKREYYKGLYYLAATGWNPSNASLFIYRRKYYQFCVPFTDWVDLLRYLLKKKPSMNVALMIDMMYRLQYVVHASCNFSMSSMKEIGKVMMEAFELKEVTRLNMKNTTQSGHYAGRKVLRNKEVTMPDEYSAVFADSDGIPAPTIRPVVPNVMSFARRLLTFQYYFDHANMFALPQILRAICCFRRHNFFVATQAVKKSVESDSTGQHLVYLDPMIFQTSFFLHLESGGILLRHKQWSNQASMEVEKLSDEERAWYYRFDTFNCLSLLAGLLQNCLIKNMPQGIIEKLCDIIVHILVDAELIEAVLRYSYYDTYFGLTSVINCVPNLMSKTVLRLLKKAPITLVSNYELASLARMFTGVFWMRTSHLEAFEIPSTMEEMSDFLFAKRRRVSMKVEGAQTGEAMSGASSMGAAGGVTIFVRNYSEMKAINPGDEAADQPASETTRKQDEERKHVKEYRRMETDVRYSSIFPSYYDGLNRVEVTFEESMTHEMCVKEAVDQRKIQNLRIH